ncbi:protein of unknown function [Hyphomicrobium sp. 1Nfss2.1]|uniref:hypothetical protein n=1 Tax=Hyphomicrobium sp. 1Nfss2.1 TaxID=3413936 RepID=UPI003C7C35D2
MTDTMEQGEGWWVEKRDGAWQVHYAHRGPGSNICVAQINHWADQPELVAHRFAASSELYEALWKLANECDGLRAFEDEIRDAIGNTNWNVLRLRVDEARAALLKASGGKDV